MTEQNQLGILVGGGPAPGINGVIGAATLCADSARIGVVGIRDGFQWLMKGDVSKSVALDPKAVSRLHFRGGSFLGTARANPTKEPQHLDATLDSLRRMGINQLVTIGGDDTAFSALKLSEHARGTLRVVHVPKTIDNDLDLPAHIPCFGYQTARHVGTGLVRDLMADAQAASRWYFVVAMGRKAGHLALGIGKAASATVTLIPEEFGSQKIPLSLIADTLAGAMIKRLASGRSDGVAILAEGLTEHLDPHELEPFGEIERDDHGHIRLAEIDFGRMIKNSVSERLKTLGVKLTIVAKDIGYELRSTDPIPFDMEYSRDLGYCAAQFLIGGGSGSMITIQEGRFRPVPFNQLIDPLTGRTRVRMVETTSEHFQIAQAYMIRLRKSDFSEPEQLARLARVVKQTPEEFRRQFERITEHEGPGLHFRA